MSYKCTEACRRNHRAPRVNINTHCLAHITASLFVLMTSRRWTFPDCSRSESCSLYYHTMPGFDLKPSLILSGRQHSAAMLFVDKTLRILPARHWGGGFGVRLSVSVRQIGRYGKFQTFLSPLWICVILLLPHYIIVSVLPLGLAARGSCLTILNT